MARQLYVNLSDIFTLSVLIRRVFFQRDNKSFFSGEKEYRNLFIVNNEIMKKRLFPFNPR